MNWQKAVFYWSLTYDGFLSSLGRLFLHRSARVNMNGIMIMAVRGRTRRPPSFLRVIGWYRGGPSGTRLPRWQIREQFFISFPGSFVLQANQFILIYSGTPLVRPPVLHQKSGLSRGVASHQGEEINTFIFRFTLPNSFLQRGWPLSGWPFKRGFTVQEIYHRYLYHFLKMSKEKCLMQGNLLWYWLNARFQKLYLTIYLVGWLSSIAVFSKQRNCIRGLIIHKVGTIKSNPGLFHYNILRQNNFN